MDHLKIMRQTLVIGYDTADPGPVPDAGADHPWRVLWRRDHGRMLARGGFKHPAEALRLGREGGILSHEVMIVHRILDPHGLGRGR